MVDTINLSIFWYVQCILLMILYYLSVKESKASWILYYFCFLFVPVCDV